MKTILAVVITALVIAPAGVAVGMAKDPRVPALQRRVAALERVIYTDIKLKTDNHSNRIDALEKKLNLLCNTFRIDSARFSDFTLRSTFFDLYQATGPCS
jgi:hypothetical protein